jgi:hypothetical protein
VVLKFVFGFLTHDASVLVLAPFNTHPPSQSLLIYSKKQ